jgi:hypothetical protein
MVSSVSGEHVFADLRRLADWFATLGGGGRATLHIERLVERLGPTSVPLLGRELASREPRRREAARAALASVATTARERVIGELQRIAASDIHDDGKVCALGLLAELGARGAARFADPSAIQRRSALALADQLESPADLAATADMMVRKLEPDDMLHLLDVLADAAPAAAVRLGSELCGRLDLEAELRERIAQAAPCDVPAAAEPRRAPRPAHVAILVDAAARVVVVASRKVLGERRWRRWAVLVDQQGHVEDCVHEDRAADDSTQLVSSLVADGYRVASSDLEHARALVTTAARKTASHDERALSSAYYLGRDLLDLGEAHLGGRTHAHPTSTTLGRAVELLADGDPARAQALLARCDAASADVAAALAGCALAAGQPGEAVAPLLRAIEAEPEWAMHHWNLAAACHQLGDARGCYHALRRFLATSVRPTGLYADADQPSRVALATRMIADLERTSRLAGTPLARPRRRRRTTKRSARR